MRGARPFLWYMSLACSAFTWYAKGMTETGAPQPRRRGRPPTAAGTMPKRNVRVSDEVWNAGDRAAAAAGMEMSAYVRAAIAEKNARAQCRNAITLVCECGIEQVIACDDDLLIPVQWINDLRKAHRSSLPHLKNAS